MTHHKTIHLKLKDFKCPTCGISFGQNSNLKRHIRAVHEGKHPFKCNYENCTSSFNDCSNLRKHIKNVHLEIKSYVCEFEGCGKRFGQKGDLTRHEAIHYENKSYKCPYECSFATIHKSNLVQHIKNKHRVEEVIDRACDSLLLPFVCKASEKFIQNYLNGFVPVKRLSEF